MGDGLGQLAPSTLGHGLRTGLVTLRPRDVEPELLPVGGEADGAVLVGAENGGNGGLGALEDAGGESAL